MEYKDSGDITNEKIEGVVTMVGGEYGNLKIDGVVTINGDLGAQDLDIDGVCTVNGGLSAKGFSCDGVLTVQGSVRAETIDIDGVVTVDGAKLEADKIVCDGVLTVKGEISADVIEADGSINAHEIVGDSITIKSYWKKGLTKVLFNIAKKTRFRFSEIELIEATTVNLRNVRAKSVNGHDVTIGKNCDIERLDCSGTLKLDETAVVKEITGGYTRI
ncbi:MAG: hypothetical protein LBS85_02955 [Clostridiales Family XIII bacterium]|jgi:cytoskeletal protein CcmA (bactofilin family)|nr:hypothetical protein [Clostridiales Family XIII bacterium]